MSPATLPSRREEFRELWKLALPIAIAQGGQSLMSFVDTAVVGRVGTQALAAVGLSSSVFFAISSFAIGLMMGVDPLVSQAFGARNTPRARELLWQGCYLATIVGTVLAVPLMVVPRVLPLFGVNFAELPEVRDYLTWRALSLPLLLLFITTRAYLQATGRPRSLVVATGVANLFNLGANILFVFGGEGLPAWFGPLRLMPALGVKGSAIATLLACAMEWVIVAWAVRRAPVAANRAWVKPVRADILNALRVGLPIGLHIAAEVGVFSLAGVLSRWLGPESMSAHQIVMSFGSITFAVALGIGNAGSVRVGWAVGARNTPRARRSGLMAFASGAGFMVMSALFYALFPQQLARLMGAPPEVISLVVPLLMVCGVFQISDGVQGVGAGVLRGAGDTRFTFYANMVGHYLVGLPVALLLGFGMKLGVVGIWWGLCAGLTAVALALFWRFERQSSGTFQPLEA
ncbi:MATE family efflux transporter [Vitiosangium sp. GDMCC 1.1324]|uniref:MATE family efflux transporter n=1 Tax=Vitiosangium sp. (strain GDMCC 1.1324) TaxID=2138576 RepID=UPI000D372D54|nr:MATE family efflux transporter [Vitiosangium sp. GDMCC 1.1324]PTL83249.1 MATE family efflux transporter [Vitiosangium sp. GDMCC 1.1324]